MILMVIFLILSVMIVIATAIYLKRKNKQTTVKNVSVSKENKKKKSKQLKDLFDIKVKDSIICSNNRYSCILRIGSIDYHMLSENEQEAIENILMQTSVSFDGYIQFFSTTENIDTSEIIDKIQKTRPLNYQIKIYKDNLISYLSNLMNSRNISILKNYIVISYTGLYKDAIQELDRRILNLKSNLLKVKVQCDLLTDNDIYNLLYRELNKNSNISKINFNEKGDDLIVKKKEKSKRRN